MNNGRYEGEVVIGGKATFAEALVKDGLFQGLGPLAAVTGTFASGRPSPALDERMVDRTMRLCRAIDETRLQLERLQLTVDEKQTLVARTAVPVRACRQERSRSAGTRGPAGPEGHTLAATTPRRRLRAPKGPLDP